MPVHDWTRVTAGIFHHFHHGWTAAISNHLNGGVLPPDYLALSEQITGGPVPDVVALHISSSPPGPTSGGVATATAPPQTQFVARLAGAPTRPRPNRVAIRHDSGRVVAVIEIVSPGNKDSRHAIRSFVEKAAELLRQGVNLLVVDLFPPTPRDPHGIHKAIWDELRDEPFTPPAGRPLTCAAYVSGWEVVGYIEPVAVGEALPTMPVYLDSEHYVPLDLEATYQATWAVFPAALKPTLEAP